MNNTEIKRAEQIKEARTFNVIDIPLLTRVFQETYYAPNTSWDYFAGTSLNLPDWFEYHHHPDSREFINQQLKLWQTISGYDREYSPIVDEKEVDIPNVDPVRFPGYYKNRGPSALEQASNHIIATGIILKHSGVKPGSWVLEYGAGFGQTALAFSRLGVNVDTVDISKTFCGFVKENADFFQTGLTPFNDVFGVNPRGLAHKYDLIYFYEAFHHALDFRNVIERLINYLNSDGKILLCGEPIWRKKTPAIPYDWGMRLDAETVVVTRSRGWMELGFSENYICSLFYSNGFMPSFYECKMTNLGNLYLFERHTTTKKIDLERCWLPNTHSSMWHTPQAGGRWTTEYSTIIVDTLVPYSFLCIDICNHLPIVKELNIEYGEKTYQFIFNPGQAREIKLQKIINASIICFRTSVHSPHLLTGGESNDNRLLGIFIASITYV
jgi:2-polyprenyl-3-methyl-5-hydroxy-6-metoxy-1,4-benzoquinol methylase